MKKISKILMLAITLFLVFFATSFVKAAQDAFGKVSNLSSGDVNVEGSGTANVKLKYNKPGEVFIGLVHRLDRPTGGIMVFARNSKSAKRLSEM